LDPKTGEVRYVGITRRFAARSAYWLRTKGYDIEEVDQLRVLTRAEARGVEQALIEHHGLRMQGGTLNNLINAIWRLNPRYADLLARGRELLITARYPGIQ
jgi:hypothetical protein